MDRLVLSGKGCRSVVENTFATHVHAQELQTGLAKDSSLRGEFELTILMQMDQ